MRKIDFDEYKKGTIKIEIKSLMPERFINLLWKNGAYIKNITKLDVTTMTMEIALKDYRKIEEISRKTDTKIRILERKGLAFLMLRINRQITLVGGAIIFIAGLYFLSTFVWNIDIVTDKTLTPYEIRQRLNAYGIKPGVPKRNINVYNIENKITKDYDDIMWVKARIEGAKLKISVIERVSPPQIVSRSEPCNIVAKMDGEIVRIFTTAGTAIVKQGDIVKAGQMLVKGEQGKEGSTYSVHASGDVVARTFYEYNKEVKIRGVKEQKTGKKSEDLYINIGGKKIYLKKSLNKFDNYVKIEESKKLLKKEVYFETETVDFNLDKDKVLKETVDALYIETLQNIEKSAKIKDEKVVNVEQLGDTIKIRVVFVVEQNIAKEQALQ